MASIQVSMKSDHVARCRKLIQTVKVSLPGEPNSPSPTANLLQACTMQENIKNYGNDYNQNKSKKERAKRCQNT